MKDGRAFGSLAEYAPVIDPYLDGVWAVAKRKKPRKNEECEETSTDQMDCKFSRMHTSNSSGAFTSLLTGKI
jgi:hypothetical protein